MLIQPISQLKGTITVPGDKSISHRSIMFGSLAKGKTHVTGFLNGADCMSTASIFKSMGVTIDWTSPTSFTLEGKGLHGLQAPSSILDVGNSGTTMRLLAGILSGQSFKTTMTGDASIVKRPMGRVITPLKKMGAQIASLSNNGLAPLSIEPAQLHGITYHSPVASAQIKSCILLATLYADSPSTVIEPAISRDHTEHMLKAFGASVTQEGLSVTIQPNPTLIGQEISVPGDISSAAYFMVAALITPGSDVILKNVGLNPTRDGIIQILTKMNGSIEILNESISNGEKRGDLRVQYSKLSATTIEGDIIPTLIDEIPVIAVAACFAEGRTIIKDAEELKVKESNRIDTMVTELKKMNATISATDDGMIIEGTHSLTGAHLKAYEDHRIAMSLTIAALRAKGDSHIEGSNCITISYPKFYEDLETLI